MRPESQAKLERIRKVSVILRVLCAVFLAMVTFVGFGAVLCMCLGRGGVGLAGRGGTIFSSAGLTLGHRVLLGAITAVTFAALSKCFYHLYRLFGDYSRGEVFTRASVGQIRQFGVACLLWGVLSFVWNLSLALSVHASPHHWPPSATFQGHGDSFVIGIILIVIAWFMEMAVDLREENELTI